MTPQRGTSCPRFFIIINGLSAQKPSDASCYLLKETFWGKVIPSQPQLTWTELQLLKMDILLVQKDFHLDLKLPPFCLLKWRQARQNVSL